MNQNKQQKQVSKTRKPPNSNQYQSSGPFGHQVFKPPQTTTNQSFILNSQVTSTSQGLDKNQLQDKANNNAQSNKINLSNVQRSLGAALTNRRIVQSNESIPTVTQFQQIGQITGKNKNVQINPLNQRKTIQNSAINKKDSEQIVETNKTSMQNQNNNPSFDYLMPEELIGNNTASISQLPQQFFSKTSHQLQGISIYASNSIEDSFEKLDMETKNNIRSNNKISSNNKMTQEQWDKNQQNNLKIVQKQQLASNQLTQQLPVSITQIGPSKKSKSLVQTSVAQQSSSRHQPNINPSIKLNTQNSITQIKDNQQQQFIEIINSQQQANFLQIKKNTEPTDQNIGKSLPMKNNFGRDKTIGQVNRISLVKTKQMMDPQMQVMYINNNGQINNQSSDMIISSEQESVDYHPQNMSKKEGQAQIIPGQLNKKILQPPSIETQASPRQKLVIVPTGINVNSGVKSQKVNKKILQQVITTPIQINVNNLRNNVLKVNQSDGFKTEDNKIFKVIKPQKKQNIVQGGQQWQDDINFQNDENNAMFSQERFNDAQELMNFGPHEGYSNQFNQTQQIQFRSGFLADMEMPQDHFGKKNLEQTQQLKKGTISKIIDGQSNTEKLRQMNNMRRQGVEQPINPLTNLQQPIIIGRNNLEYHIQDNQYISGVGSKANGNRMVDLTISQLPVANLAPTSTSASNKIRKTFDFELEQAQQQQRGLKKERKKELGISNINQQLPINSNIQVSTPNMIVNQKKSISINKKGTNPNNQIITGVNFSSIANKKTTIQKPGKIKTLMNLTGPLPKHMLSPATTATNQIKSKNKHSQYFDNASEIASQIVIPSTMIQHQTQNPHGLILQQPTEIQNFNPSLIQQQQQQAQHNMIVPHQYQVHVNGLPTASATQNGRQHQITTQGGSTVININIDSNGWGQPPIRQQLRHPVNIQNEITQGQKSSRDNQTGEIHSSDHFLHRMHQRHQRQDEPLTQQYQTIIRANQHQSQEQPLTNFRRQSSSKMKRTDSISSNKSRSRYGQGLDSNNNNRRSSSSSHLRNFATTQVLNQNPVQYFSNQGISTQILSQNIAKINERLMQYFIDKDQVADELSTIGNKTQILRGIAGAQNEMADYNRVLNKTQQISWLNQFNNPDLVTGDQKFSLKNNMNNVSEIEQNLPQKVQMYQVIPQKQSQLNNQQNQQINAIQITRAGKTHAVGTPSNKKSNMQDEGTIERNKQQKVQILVMPSGESTTNSKIVQQIKGEPLANKITNNKSQIQQQGGNSGKLTLKKVAISQGKRNMASITQVPTQQANTLANKNLIIQTTSENISCVNSARRAFLLTNGGQNSTKSNTVKQSIQIKIKEKQKNPDTKSGKVQGSSLGNRKENQNLLQKNNNFKSCEQLEEYFIHKTFEFESEKRLPVFIQQIYKDDVKNEQNHFNDWNSRIKQQQNISNDQLDNTYKIGDSSEQDVMAVGEEIEGMQMDVDNEDGLIFNDSNTINFNQMNQQQIQQLNQSINIQQNFQNNQGQFVHYNQQLGSFVNITPIQTINGVVYGQQIVPNYNQNQNLEIQNQYQYMQQNLVQQQTNQKKPNSSQKGKRGSSTNQGSQQSKGEKNAGSLFGSVGTTSFGNKRQISHEDYHNHSIRNGQNSQMRGSHSKKIQSSANRASKHGNTSSSNNNTNVFNDLKNQVGQVTTNSMKGKGSRSTVISLKGSSISQKSRAGRGSKLTNNNFMTNTQITSKTGKQMMKSHLNIENMQLDIDGIMRNQLLMDSSLGLAAAVLSFGTKKSVTTKNQVLSQKLQSQNVQNLLREAKREIVNDIQNNKDQILVGGDDLTLKNQKNKKFIFNGTQKLALGPQINNFSVQQNRLNIQCGISPKQRQINYGDLFEAASNQKTTLANNQPLILNAFQEESFLKLNDGGAYTGKNATNSELMRLNNNDFITQAFASNLGKSSVQNKQGIPQIPQTQIKTEKFSNIIKRNLKTQNYLQGNSTVVQDQTSQGNFESQLAQLNVEKFSNSKMSNQNKIGSIPQNYASNSTVQGISVGNSKIYQNNLILQENILLTLPEQNLDQQISPKKNGSRFENQQDILQVEFLNENDSVGTAQGKAGTFALGNINFKNKINNKNQTQQLNFKDMKFNEILQTNNYNTDDLFAQRNITELNQTEKSQKNPNIKTYQYMSQGHINSNSQHIENIQASSQSLMHQSESQKVFSNFNGPLEQDFFYQDQSNFIQQKTGSSNTQSQQLMSNFTKGSNSIIFNNQNAESQVFNESNSHIHNSYTQNQLQTSPGLNQFSGVPTTNQSLKIVNVSEMTDDSIQQEVYFDQKTQSVNIEITDQQKKVYEQPELPNTGAKVLKFFLKKDGLTEFEKSEVLDYKQVYYLGLGSEKVKGHKNNQYNFGYDDDRGDYMVVLGDQIAFRFQVLDFLGKGSFGQALKCFDHKTQEIVAIKIIRNKKKFQHQAGVELKILLHLRDNDIDDTNNIIRIKDYCMFRNHLIISFELFSINLYEFIKNNNFEGVSLSLIRRFAIQILQALKYLREENLIHCDLKPENILLKSPDKSGIKVIDFGSSCFVNERIYTYIQSRFYRAPEIILGIPYTPAIDMWSFGCILTELFTGVPLYPGESEQEQLTLIMEVLGMPSEHILSQATRKNVFFDNQTNEPYLTQDSQGNLRIPGCKPLEEVLQAQSDTFLDFITRCLDWDPEQRMTPFDALMHEWIIEGLPPQVLIHHKKMLGICSEESDKNQEIQFHQEETYADENIEDQEAQGI